MSTCCGLQQQFDDRTARRDLRRYRRRGPSRPTRLLLEAIKAEGVAGASVLDIGGGVGTIQHELLRLGALQSVSVDVSASYLAAARTEGERRGTADRMTFVAADFVTVAERTPESDIVTLDRVICCYPDMVQLVDASTRRARRLYGLVYPRSGSLFQVGARVANALMTLRRCDFRLFVHSTEAVDRCIRERGFVLCFSGATVAWQVFLYRRIGERAN